MKRLPVFLLISLALTGTAVAQGSNSPDKVLGRRPFTSYFDSDIDSINAYNGNLMIDITLFSRPGRQLPTDLRVSYNSKGWQTYGYYQQYASYMGGWNIREPVGRIGYGVSLDYCYQDYQSPELNYAVWGASGSWIERPGLFHNYYSNQAFVYGPTACDNPPYDQLASLTPYELDGSSMGTDGAGGNPMIVFRDGTVLRDDGTAKLITTNGNYLERGASYVNPLPAQDTLGRTIGFSTDYPGYTPPLCDYTYTDPIPYHKDYAITDANGQSQTYRLNFENNHFTYNPVEGCWEHLDGFLKSIVLPNGRSYVFDYDSWQGYLTKVTLPSGAYIRYEYQGGIYSQTYGDDYIVARHVSPDGTAESEKTWTYARVDSGPTRYVTVTTPSPSPGVQGHEITYTFNNLGQQTQAVYRNAPGGDPQQTVTTTWLAGRPVQVDTQVGGVTRRTTTSWNNLSYPTEQEESDWYPVNGGVVPRMKTTYSYAYLPYSGMMKPSSISLFGWDGGQYVQQGLTQYSYDEYAVSGTPSNVPNKTSPVFTDRGNVTTVRQYKDGSNYIEQHFYYDDVGNLVQSVDALGHPTSIGYADNFISNPSFPTYALPTSVTNALNQSVTTKYDYNTGLVKNTYDLRNLQTTFTYDLMDRPLTVLEANGRSTTYTYTDSTPMVTEEVLVDAGKTRKTEIIFDRLNRPIRTQLYDPAGTVFIDTQYDGNGRAVKVSQPYRSGTPVWTETSYDVLNRPLSITNPDSTQTTFAYADNTVTTTDEAGNQRRMTSDTGGQLVKVEEPNPTLSSPLETTYSYYAFGSLKQVTQGSQTRAFTYDWLGSLTQEQHPETGTTYYSYYNNGLLSDRTDARNITTHYTYDNIDRPWTISYNDGTTPGITYAYDQNGFTGFLTNVNVAGVTASTFEYFGNAGLLKKETVSLTGVSGSFASEYTYDYDGRLLTAKYPSGRIVTQTYDSGGGVASDRLASLTDSPSSATLIQSVQDNAAGQITNRTLSTGIIETRTFNPRNQLQRIAASANSATLLDMTYGYGSGNNGRIRSRTDAVQPEHSANYTFDEIGRLKEVSGGNSGWGISWSIDRYGNRTSQTPSGLASGRVGSETLGYTNNKNTSWTYDNAGNVTYDGIYHYYYDAENRLYQIDSSSIQYAYDSDGRRIKKTAGGTATYYVYGLTGLMSEFSTSTTLSTAASAAATDRIQYSVGEQTGTAVILADSDGTPRENNRVFPFGEPWLSFVASDNAEKFTTYRHDGESDLDYAMARYYASRSGRFMTPDPGHAGANVSNPQSWNAYVYSNNDSINFTDPSGLCQVDQNGNLREDSGTPCWMAQIGPNTGVTVTADPYWVPCTDLESGQPTGACTGMSPPDVFPAPIPRSEGGGSAGGGSGRGGVAVIPQPTKPNTTSPPEVPGGIAAKFLPPLMNGARQFFKQKTRGYPKTNFPNPKPPLSPVEPPPELAPPVPVSDVPWYKSVPLKLLELFDNLRNGAGDFIIIVDPCLLNPYMKGCYQPEGPGA